jgi:hypothetical protein
MLREFLRRELHAVIERNFEIAHTLQSIGTGINPVYDQTFIRLRFSEDRWLNIAVPHGVVERAAPRMRVDLIDLNNLYWRCYEDCRIHREERNLRAQLEERLRHIPPDRNYEIQQLIVENQQRLAHMHAHHRIDPPTMYPGGNMTATEVMARQRRTVWPDSYSYDDTAAHERAKALLLASLSPSQRVDYTNSRSFRVDGSAGGKFRINYGRTMNVDMLNWRGARHCRYCFLPQGGLVEEDVMLAQKIALETNEKAALAIANRG